MAARSAPAYIPRAPGRPAARIILSLLLINADFTLQGDHLPLSFSRHLLSLRFFTRSVLITTRFNKNCDKYSFDIIIFALYDNYTKMEYMLFL